MEINKENIECCASGAHIDDMFRNAKATENVENEGVEKDARKDSFVDAGDPSEFGAPAVYPEECCDAAEISDEDYERWKEGSEKGFWQTFIKSR